MANILISTLGKGPYFTSKYKFVDSNHEYETPFVIEALSEYLQIDKIFLLGTANLCGMKFITILEKQIQMKKDQTAIVN